MRNGIRITAMLLAIASVSEPASALPVASRMATFNHQNDLIEPVVIVRRGFVARGPRGGVIAGGRTVVRPPYVRPVRPVVPVRPVWVRPPNYWWHPGMAILSGAAIGAISASAAAAWAGRPPAPGYCWYYTDASKRQGFWDVCP